MPSEIPRSSFFSSSMHPKWPPLLTWLENLGFDSQKLGVEVRETTDGSGYGLFATREIAPSTTLFTIPGKALLNSLTLANYYPKADPPLTSMQIISMHLLLHRPTSGGPWDSLFGPFIDILPGSFDGHPLTWLIKQQQKSSEDKVSIEWCLMSHLPPFVARDLQRISTTFYADWNRVLAYLEEYPEALAKATNDKALGSDPTTAIRDFLWAWLNVNTRCIHYRVKAKQADTDNLTLCPILDFANHSDSLPTAYPQAGKCELWNIAPQPEKGDDFVLLSPLGAMTLEGQEIFLRYGHHTNQFLFIEYGFVNVIPVDAAEKRAFGSVDISPDVENLFAERGNVGAWMKKTLEEEGYWGLWTMHLAPAPACPDYRLISALRLYASVPSGVQEVPNENVLDEWRQTIYGKRDSISAENERVWRETLLGLCKTVENRARSKTKAVRDLLQLGNDGPPWAGYALGCIKILWEEEERVSRAVAESVRRGVDF